MEVIFIIFILGVHGQRRWH